jgi:hypothetical protein
VASAILADVVALLGDAVAPAITYKLAFEI